MSVKLDFPFFHLKAETPLLSHSISSPPARVADPYLKVGYGFGSGLKVDIQKRSKLDSISVFIFTNVKVKFVLI